MQGTPLWRRAAIQMPLILEVSTGTYYLLDKLCLPERRSDIHVRTFINFTEHLAKDKGKHIFGPH